MKPLRVRAWHRRPPLHLSVVVLLAAVLFSGAGGGPPAAGRTAAGGLHPSPRMAGIPQASLAPSAAALAAAGSNPARSPARGPEPDATFSAGLQRPVGLWANQTFAWPTVCSRGTSACPLQMDVYAPLSGGPWPLVVALPGGPADPAAFGYLGELAIPLAARGAVVITAGWQMRSQDGAGYPQSFEDVACAIGVARGLAAEFGASPERVTLVGHSLGAWAAEVVALGPPMSLDSLDCPGAQGSLRPDALVAIDGAPWGSFDSYVGAGYLESLLGGDEAGEPAAWSAVDPLVQLAQPATPRVPVLVIHGTADTTIPEAFSLQLDAALLDAGYPATYVAVPGATHGSVLGAVTTVDAISQLVGIT
jgi:acetyl esterase/lipase